MSSEKIRKLGTRNFDGIKLSKLTKGAFKNVITEE